MTDLNALGLTIWGEARGEPIEGKVGVAWVMRNRVEAQYRGAHTYVDVCTAHAQFSAWTDEATAMRLEAAKTPVIGTHSIDPILSLCLEIAAAVIAAKLPDPTAGANHYYADTIPPPPWAVGPNGINLAPLAHLGHHLFFNVA